MAIVSMSAALVLEETPTRLNDTRPLSIIFLMQQTFLLLFLRVHDVAAAHRVEDQGEEAEGQAEQHTCQHRVAAPHVGQ